MIFKNIFKNYKMSLYLNTYKIENNDFHYLRQIFSSYLKNLSKVQSNNTETDYYYNYTDDEDDSGSNYLELMAINAISIKANTTDEAKLIDFILRVLFSGSMGLVDIMIERYKEHMSEKEWIQKNPLTTEELVFLTNLVELNKQLELKKYALELLHKQENKDGLEKNRLSTKKNISFTTIYDNLDQDKRWNVKDWLDGVLDEEDFDKYNETFPHEYIDDEEEEEEKPRKSLPEQLTSLKISENENEDGILLSDFMEYIISTSDLDEYDDYKSKILKQPIKKSIKLQIDNSKIKFNTEEPVVFDKKRVLQILKESVNMTNSLARYEQLLNL